MIGDVTVKAVEVSAKVAETAKEVGKEIAKEAVDITKRIDVTTKPTELKISGVDITKRISPEKMIDIGNKDLKEIAKDYIEDLKAKSEFSDTINPDNLDTSKLEKISPEQRAKMREEFDDNKSKLRKEWEKINGKEWPRYTEDICNDAERPIRHAGDCYDAHHVIPLELGGKNVASNLTPLDLGKHQEIHSVTGSCTRLVEKVKSL